MHPFIFLTSKKYNKLNTLLIIRYIKPGKMRKLVLSGFCVGEIASV